MKTAIRIPLLASTVVVSIVVLSDAAAGLSWRAGTGATPTGVTRSVTVSGINDRGQIIGNLTTKAGVHHGFVWRRGSLRLLGAQASQINERGQVLGHTQYFGHDVPALWDNGKRKRLGLSPVFGLNDRGQVLGGKGGAGGDYLRGGSPALWTDGAIRRLPFLPDWGVAFNDVGQVVGETSHRDVGEWQDGHLTELGPGNPIAINDRGEILGYSQDGDVIVWQNGSAIDIGHGRPIAINDRGEVIWYSDENPSGPSDTFLWRNGKSTDLGAVAAVAISDSGQVVGAVENSDGDEYGFVWQSGHLTRLPPPKGYAGFSTRAVAINDHNQIVGDDLLESQSVRGRSKFAVLWTLKGGKISTVRIAGRGVGAVVEARRLQATRSNWGAAGY